MMKRSRWPATPPAYARVRETGGRGAAYFYSRDIGRIWRVAEAFEYGIVGINEDIIATEIAPFWSPSGRLSRARLTRAPRDRPAPERRSGPTLVGSEQNAAPAAHR